MKKKGRVSVMGAGQGKGWSATRHAGGNSFVVFLVFVTRMCFFFSIFVSRMGYTVKNDPRLPCGCRPSTSQRWVG